METPLLDECLYLLSLSVDEDNDDAFNKMTDPDLDIYDRFLKPLDKEINHLLLGKETTNGKRDMIKYFISLFVEPSLMFKRYNQLFEYSYNGSGRQWKLTSGDRKQIREANPMESYVLCAKELYDIIFHIFQNCCITYEIDFIELINDLAFNIDHIDESMIDIYENEKFRQLFGISNEIDDSNLPWIKGDKKSPESKRMSKIEMREFIKSINEYGFNELPLISDLNPEKLKLLLEEIYYNKIPYKIAMFDFLGFIKKLRKDYFNTQSEMFDYLAVLFHCSKRTVSGNIFVLNDRSKEKEGHRYTANNNKLQVIKDYQLLK